MHDRWRFVVPGAPVAQGRPRFARCGRGVRAYDPGRSVSWKVLAAEVFRNFYSGPPLDEPVVVDVRAVVQRPKRLMRGSDPSHRLPCPCRPDCDNYGKAALDALVRAGVLRDDALVVELSVTKSYTALDEGPRVEVDVSKIGAADD